MHLLIHITRSARHALCACLMLGLSAGAVASPIQETKPQAPPESQAAKDLPKVSTLLKQARDAMGGMKAMKAVESIYSRAEMELPQMQGAPQMEGKMVLETRWAKPDRLLISQSMPGRPAVQMGYNGEVGWMNMGAMGGYQLMRESMIDEFRDRSNMHMMLMDIEQEMAELETVDRTTFDERDCYKIRMVEKVPEDDSNEPARTPVVSFLYLESGSKLPAGLEAESQGQPLVVKFRDWKPVGDVKMFRTMGMVNPMGMELEMVYTTIELNQVDPKVFELPEEVKKMVEEQKESPEKPSAQPGSAPPPPDKAEDIPPATGPLTDEEKAKLNERIDEMLAGDMEPARLRMMASVLEQQATSDQLDERQRLEVLYIVERIREHLKKLEAEKDKKNNEDDKDTK